MDPRQAGKEFVNTWSFKEIFLKAAAEKWKIEEEPSWRMLCPEEYEIGVSAVFGLL